MKTFPSYDYTLCDREECQKKESCMRYLTYRKSQEEKYEFRISVYCPEEVPDPCSMYVEAKEFKP